MSSLFFSPSHNQQTRSDPLSTQNAHVELWGESFYLMHEKDACSLCLREKRNGTRARSRSTQEPSASKKYYSDLLSLCFDSAVIVEFTDRNFSFAHIHGYHAF